MTAALQRGGHFFMYSMINPTIIGLIEDTLKNLTKSQTRKKIIAYSRTTALIQGAVDLYAKENISYGLL